VYPRVIVSPPGIFEPKTKTAEDPEIVAELTMYETPPAETVKESRVGSVFKSVSLNPTVRVVPFEAKTAEDTVGDVTSTTVELFLADPLVTVFRVKEPVSGSV
jgi:hypothetical protein